MQIFIDESGDLGFNFTKTGISRYFVVTALVCNNRQTTQKITKAVISTIRNKLSKKIEIKAKSTSLPIKKYFYQKCSPHPDWYIYTIILDKKQCIRKQNHYLSKNTLYDNITKTLLLYIDFSETVTPVEIVVDRSKNSYAIENFDNTIKSSLVNKLNGRKLFIRHCLSFEEKGLQAVDLFCNGIYQKYENDCQGFYDVFRERIHQEGLCKN